MPRVVAETDQEQTSADQDRGNRDVGPGSVAVDQPAHGKAENAGRQSTGGLHPPERGTGQRQIPLHGQDEKAVVQGPRSHRREVDGEHGGDDDPPVEDSPLS